MHEGPNISQIAALVADPVRSAMLVGLMDGRALTATELATISGISKQTASSHLAKLVDGQVLSVEVQGRHRYFCLAGEHVARLLEGLMVFTHEVTTSQAPVRTGPKDKDLRKARICYDHLAGEMGVNFYEHMHHDQWLCEDVTITDKGWAKFEEIGIYEHELPSSNRPLCRACLDWSQRRHHLAGRLGKALLDRLEELSWARRQPGSRIIRFTPEGERLFLQWSK